METKDYNMIMQEMLKYSTMYGSDTLNFETYSQLYHKIVAMLEHAKIMQENGMHEFRYIDASNNVTVVTISQVQDTMNRVIESAKDNTYKLEPFHAHWLNQFAKQTNFKYTPKQNAVSDASIEYAMEAFKRLAGLTYNSK